MRRPREETVADISKIAAEKEEGELKSYIKNKAGLDFKQINEYLELLLDANLLDKIKVVEKIKGGVTRYKETRYRVTPKGNKYLESFKLIKKLLSEMRERELTK